MKKYDLSKYNNSIDKIRELYCTELLSDEDIASLIGGDAHEIQLVRRYNNIKLTRKQIYDTRIKTSIENKYGVDNVFRLDSIKNKIYETNISKYGVRVPTQNKEIYNKIKQTCLEKYGSECVLASKKFSVDNFGCTSINQKDIPDNIRDIIYDKNKFIEFISNIDWNIRTRINIASLLNISYSLVERLCYEYDIENLVNRYSSSGEQELFQFISNLGFKCEKSRSIIFPLEIDVYVPDKKVGFEFNGIYWHKVNDDESNYNYHQNKSNYAKSKGIFIYHIWEHEWYDTRKRPIIESQICNLLGINNSVIYARKCVIKDVSSKESAEFLNNNHIQGIRASKVRLGLYYNNELILLMTFGIDKFIDKSDNWQLLRLCSKIGYTVVGGASKLFKYFINKYNPERIISYCDISKGRGIIYNKLGFKLMYETPPNYIWYNMSTGDIKTRYQSQKRYIKDSNNDTRTENEIMTNMGYIKLSDCGSYKFIWENENDK